MSVVRVNKNKDYTVMSNCHLREKNMSYKAKGLLSFMLSLPDDWDYSIAGLVAISKENSTAIKNMLKELQDFGYLRVTKLMPNKQENRARIEYVYDIFEQPQKTEKQDIENLYIENQYIDNPTQINTKEINTKEINTKELKKERKKGEEQKKSPSRKGEIKSTTYEWLIDEFTDNEELKATIYEYIKMRKLSKAPMTDRALRLALNKLSELASDESNQIKILEQSIMNCWKGLFPLKDEHNKQSISEKYKQIDEAYYEEWD